jgi:hypothetical protein
MAVVSSGPLRSPSISAGVPERVCDARLNAFTDFESMLAALSAVDVVFVGEQHDDPNRIGSSRNPRRLAAGIDARRLARDVRRDIQPLLDGTGRTDSGR